MFFTAVYISSSLVLGVVFSVINVGTLFIPYWPPALALGISLLLSSKTALNLNFIVIEPGFIPKAIYNHSFMG